MSRKYDREMSDVVIFQGDYAVQCLRERVHNVRSEEDESGEVERVPLAQIIEAWKHKVGEGHPILAHLDEAMKHLDDSTRCLLEAEFQIVAFQEKEGV